MSRGPELPPSTSDNTASFAMLHAASDQSLRVLVVDDDKLSAELRCVLLRSLGYVSTSGIDAMSRADIKDFDIILLDHDMPILNGWQTAQKLREIGIDSMIVMFSGRTEIPPDTVGIVDASVSKGEGVSSLKFTLVSVLERRVTRGTNHQRAAAQYTA